MPMPGQPAQGAGIGQQFLGAAVEARPLPEVGDVDERAALARRLDPPRVVFAKALDHPQPQAQRRLRAGQRFQVAIPGAGAHVHRANRQMVPARVLEDLVGAVEAHGPAVDQGAGEGRRLVAFEPATGIGQQGETGGVGFGETVAAEALDLLEDLRGEFVAVAIDAHAVAQA